LWVQVLFFLQLDFCDDFEQNVVGHIQGFMLCLSLLNESMLECGKESQSFVFPQDLKVTDNYVFLPSLFLGSQPTESEETQCQINGDLNSSFFVFV
jgi:hypothetical protein